MNKFQRFFSWLPNSITAMNLVSGVLAIVLGIEGELGLAALFIIAAAIFDFLDGLLARIVHSYSEIGKQLDSLADLVSFGVAPAAILLGLLEQTWFQGHLRLTEIQASPPQWILMASVLLVPVAGAFRLAKFNIDTRQSESFLGLPIPANAMFYASLALILDFGKSAALNHLILNPYFIATAIIVFPCLMISEIPMFSLKVKHLKWKGNQVRFLFLALCVVLIITLQLYSLPLIMISYILISLFMAIPRRKI